MSRHVKKLTLLLAILFSLAYCDSGNNLNDINLSKNRIADMTILKIKIENIDLEITSISFLS